MKHVTKMKHTGFELGIHSHKLKTIRHDWESFHKQPLHLDEPQKKKKKDILNILTTRPLIPGR